MRKLFNYIVPALLCICLLNACKKSFNEQQSVPVPPDQPDLTAQIRMSVVGFVTNENGDAIFNASVEAGDKQTSTNEYGYFKINDVLLSKTAGFIMIRKPGYFDGYRTFVGKENQESFSRIRMVPKTDVGTINATAGGTVNTTDGASVTLPPGAVVFAGNNAPYYGTIHVAAHHYQQNNITEWSQTIPGDQRGTDSDGYMKLLESYGMLAVELTDDAGQLLQIATGKEATITTPIPSALTAFAPASIALWSFNTANGLWKQESTATKNGNVYTGNVQHFSFWDGAVGVPLVNLTAQIVNSTMQPLANVFVGLRLPGQPYNSGYTSYGYTNAQGIVSGAVLANQSLILDVLTPCNLAAYEHPFTTTTSDIDLGAITGDFGQSMITITGTGVNCILSPIASGRVMLHNGNVNQIINFTNGNFNFSYIGCTNTPTTYLVIDDVANQQGMPNTNTLVAGVNDLGSIMACGSSTVGFIDYRIDSGPWTQLVQSVDSMTMGGFYSNDGFTHILTMGGGQNTNPDMRFDCDGGIAIGNTHLTHDIYSIAFPSKHGISVTGISVDITEYGNIGEFIAGEYDGYAEDFDDHILHHIECRFRVRRYL